MIVSWNERKILMEQMVGWVGARAKAGLYADALREMKNLAQHRDKMAGTNGRNFTQERKLIPELTAKVGEHLLKIDTKDPAGLTLIKDYLHLFGCSVRLAATYWGDQGLNDQILDALSRQRLAPTDLVNMVPMFKEDSTPEHYLRLALFSIERRAELGSLSMVFARVIAPTVSREKLGEYAPELDEALLRHRGECNRRYRWNELLACHRAGLVGFATSAVQENTSNQAKGNDLVDARKELGRVLTQEEHNRFWDCMTKDAIHAIGLYMVEYGSELVCAEPEHRNSATEYQPFKDAIAEVLAVVARQQPEKLKTPEIAWMIDQFCSYWSPRDAAQMKFLERDVLMQSSRYRDIHMAVDLGL